MQELDLAKSILLCLNYNPFLHSERSLSSKEDNDMNFIVVRHYIDYFIKTLNNEEFKGLEEYAFDSALTDEIIYKLIFLNPCLGLGRDDQDSDYIAEVMEGVEQEAKLIMQNKPKRDISNKLEFSSNSILLDITINLLKSFNELSEDHIKNRLNLLMGIVYNKDDKIFKDIWFGILLTLLVEILISKITGNYEGIVSKELYKLPAEGGEVNSAIFWGIIKKGLDYVKDDLS